MTTEKLAWTTPTLKTARVCAPQHGPGDDEQDDDEPDDGERDDEPDGAP